MLNRDAANDQIEDDMVEMLQGTAGINFQYHSKV